MRGGVGSAGHTFAFRRWLVLCTGFHWPRFRRGVEGNVIVAIRIRIGTRKSVRALAQTEEIARRLTAAAPDIDVEIVQFASTGDLDQTGKLLQHRGKARAFVADIPTDVV